ncbi:glucose-1-phosphate adenylyltransferase subunit GlgD [Lachnoclostridium sp. An14]|uniref:glucose-1-phosphate adenylyltransferase subunit GlgD n=1 Tax=Lachnoclostridium sp. An14 TaxID=1965562 RepID=UPI000B3AFD1C|nr:glucose-1-phosphate adenylyltransferase subunit GlgD [Lachnoclostridium sp. An14]OUQ19087.1 glucose-1-phosphate adenylyltransferase subunit GlgD [Lachnoclostridium sp. An14]
MVNSNVDALGIIFPNSRDGVVPELVGERLMASIPFAGRYRMIDFILSSMVNSGIGNVSIIVRKNYHSLMDHLGSGREWDLTRKNGGLNIVPPFAEKTIKVYNGRLEALASILDFLRDQKEKYVVMSDADIAVNFDFSAMIDAHVKSGADVTMAYTKEKLPEAVLAERQESTEFYYTLTLDEGRVTGMEINAKDTDVTNYSMGIYVVERELLIKQITYAYTHGFVNFERDILMNQLDKLNVQAYCYEGYIARITGMKGYFDENMRLLEEENLDALFSPSPIYTKIRDDNPTRYITGAKVENIMAADGCVIEGEVENSVLFRGVKVAKGAKVKNCVLMQDTVVEEGANIEYIVSDKNVTITAGKEVKGTDTFPVYVAKYQKV